MMNKIGRNDPCPCGSGKKYKNCCLSKDRAARLRESIWRRDEQLLLDRLIAFAQRADLAQTIVASNLFWNGNYGVEGLNALDKDEIKRFLDWYIFDYRMEQSGKRLIELFSAEIGPSLLPVEQEQIRTWQSSYLSLYRIVSSDEQGLLTLVDALQSSTEAARDNGLGRLGLSGDLIVGRILRSPEPAHLSWAAILLPSVVEASFVAFCKRAYEDYQQMHFQASWPDFLSNSGYIFNHYLLKSAAEGGQNRRPSAAYYDAFTTVEKLRAAEKRLQERAIREMEKQRRAEQRVQEEELEHLRQTRGGILLPGHVRYKGSRELE
jgi:hypothetical protein